jgi:hypothetical protein
MASSPAVLEREAELAEDVGIVALQFQHAAIGVDGLVETGECVQGEGQVMVRFGRGRLELDRAAVCGGGGFEPAQGVQGNAQVGVRLGRGGLDRDGPPQDGDRLVEPTLRLERSAQVVVRHRQARRKLDRALEARNRPVGLPRPEIGLTEVVVRLGATGIAGDGPANQLDRRLEVSCLACKDAQQMECTGVVGIVGQDLAIQRLGLGQPAGPVMLHGELHRLV